MNKTSSALQPVRVWDLPTRLFHWSLALAVVGSLVSGKMGGNAMVWHFRFGYVVLALLLFRLAWGVLGGYWSRFARFFYLPGTIVRYLRGRHQPGEHLDVGHSPLGSLSVWALLGFLLLQAATGLVSDDEISNVGPLNKFVATAVAGAAGTWHKVVGQRVLLVLVVLHVAAVLFYLWRKKVNLLRPMLSGDKLLPGHTPASRDDARMRALALACMALAALVAAWVAAQ